MKETSFPDSIVWFEIFTGISCRSNHYINALFTVVLVELCMRHICAYKVAFDGKWAAGIMEMNSRIVTYRVLFCAKLEDYNFGMRLGDTQRCSLLIWR